MTKQKRLAEALLILNQLGLPKAQQNERTALCLLALLNLSPTKNWSEAQAPLIGITPIMDWSKKHYSKEYAPNSRESFRRYSIHQFIAAAICIANVDDPTRPVNSGKTVYQISPELLKVLKTFNTDNYQTHIAEYLKNHPSLVEKYASERDMIMIPVKVKDGVEIKLSAGKHSQLIKDIVLNFGSLYVKNGELIYVGDTGNKQGYFNTDFLKGLGVELDNHGKLPDVVIYDRAKNWLLLIESVTSHGPVDSKRHSELETLFKKCTAGLVYVSAFPNRKVFLKYLPDIAWETEVWIADAPTHMIHFNGSRFLGPY
jgi:BsuBI/PstI restriction endonuclease domain/BsuBI/PstI restriction endonuclease HTH domain